MRCAAACVCTESLILNMVDPCTTTSVAAVGMCGAVTSAAATGCAGTLSRKAYIKGEELGKYIVTSTEGNVHKTVMYAKLAFTRAVGRSEEALLTIVDKCKEQKLQREGVSIRSNGLSMELLAFLAKECTKTGVETLNQEFVSCNLNTKTFQLFFLQYVGMFSDLDGCDIVSDVAIKLCCSIRYYASTFEYLFDKLKGHFTKIEANGPQNSRIYKRVSTPFSSRTLCYGDEFVRCLRVKQSGNCRKLRKGLKCIFDGQLMFLDTDVMLCNEDCEDMLDLLDFFPTAWPKYYCPKIKETKEYHFAVNGMYHVLSRDERISKSLATICQLTDIEDKLLVLYLILRSIADFPNSFEITPNVSKHVPLSAKIRWTTDDICRTTDFQTCLSYANGFTEDMLERKVQTLTIFLLNKDTSPKGIVKGLLDPGPKSYCIFTDADQALMILPEFSEYLYFAADRCSVSMMQDQPEQTEVGNPLALLILLHNTELPLLEIFEEIEDSINSPRLTLYKQLLIAVRAHYSKIKSGSLIINGDVLMQDIDRKTRHLSMAMTGLYQRAAFSFFVHIGFHIESSVNQEYLKLLKFESLPKLENMTFTVVGPICAIGLLYQAECSLLDRESTRIVQISGLSVRFSRLLDIIEVGSAELSEESTKLLTRAVTFF